VIRQKNRMARSRTVIFLLLLVLPGCSKEEEAAAELADLQAAYQEAAMSESEKRAAFAPGYQTLVEEYWGTAAAFDAALWLMRKAAREAPRSQRPQVMAEFTDSILGRYAGSPSLGKLGEHASLFTEEQRIRYFGELRNSSPHPSVRAASIFYPAQLRIRRLRPKRILPGAPSHRGTGEDGEPVELKAAKADLRMVMEAYGDLPCGNSTYGVMADALLNPHTAEALAVGQPAPEIIGRNVDGEEIRLSDFEGRVTVINFWGDW